MYVCQGVSLHIDLVFNTHGYHCKRQELGWSDTCGQDDDGCDSLRPVVYPDAGQRADECCLYDLSR